MRVFVAGGTGVIGRSLIPCSPPPVMGSPPAPGRRAGPACCGPWAPSLPWRAIHYCR